jgi:glutamyl-tRNA synthetase
MNELRVRFAPSPTGYLHIGGARTALFNYLLARQQHGTFILRIEDTDVERSTQASTDAILQAMDWLGLDYDEGPYFQSDRFELYRSEVERLLHEGKAYRCYCSTEELEKKREAALTAGGRLGYDGTCRNRQDQPADAPYVVRFRTPQAGTTTFLDRIKGPISINNEELDDLIIQRTDGTPTYNFVVVVDDADMRITLVIRGDDHINNTPRQIHIYEALGVPVPEFAHVPMILGADKKRLSKRHGATSVMAYRELGFLPEALVNYLVRLGWSHGDQEIFTKAELIEKFSLENVGRAAGVFNPDKLLWLNEHYIKTGDPQRLGGLLVEMLEARGITVADGPSPAAVAVTLQDRAKTLVEMADGAAFYYLRPQSYDCEAIERHVGAEQIRALAELCDRLDRMEEAAPAVVEDVFQQVLTTNGLKLGKLGPAVRIALTGGTVSPGIFEVVATLGCPETVVRLRKALAVFGAAAKTA